MPDDGNNLINLPDGTIVRYGERLEADVYDAQGVLLLKAGEIVQQKHWVPWLEGRNTGPALLQQYQASIAPGDVSSHASRLDIRQAQADILSQQTEVARVAKQEAVSAVASVFDRILQKEQIDVGILRSVVSSMVTSLVKDSRALLSMALIKNVDDYTHTHSVNVCVLATCLSMRVGHASDTEDIGIGGLVHDIGKIETPSDILRKPGPLNSAEAYVIRQHPTIGARVLANSGGFSPVSILCARDHHEWVNGRGYPSGKNACEICTQAQIVSIADVYDALTTDRPYRPALSPQQALTLMTRKLSDAFAPDLLRSFVSMVGYHPVGSTINLVNGYGAVVLQNNPADPSKPVLVQTVTAPDGTLVRQRHFIDLRTHPHLLRDVGSNDAVEDKAVPLVMRELRGLEAPA